MCGPDPALSLIDAGDTPVSAVEQAVVRFKTSAGVLPAWNASPRAQVPRQ